MIISRQFHQSITSSCDESLLALLKKFHEWLAYEKGNSQNTLKSYFYDLGMFFPFFYRESGNIMTIESVSLLNLSDVRRCLFWRNENGCKNSSKRFLSSLKSFARFLLKNGIEIDQRILLIDQAKSDKVLPRPLTRDQIAEIAQIPEMPMASGQDETNIYVEALNDGVSNDKMQRWERLQDRAIFLTLYATGLRISEIISLNLGDFSYILQNGYAIIVGKGNKERIVPFLKDSVCAIQEYLFEAKRYFADVKAHSCAKDGKKDTKSIKGIEAMLENQGNTDNSHEEIIDDDITDENNDKNASQNNSSENSHNKNLLSKDPSSKDNETENTPLFMSKNRKRITPGAIQMKMRLRRIEMALGDRATPHSFRHSFASHLIENGAELRYVQELLGHSSAKSTQVYTEINTKTLLKEHRNAHPRSKLKNDNHKTKN